jgi:hypothetical protein
MRIKLHRRCDLERRLKPQIRTVCKQKEITMSNQIYQNERHAGISGFHSFGGIAPLREDLALHAYLEKKLMHADIDGRQRTQGLQNAIVHVIKIAIRAPGAAALNWLQTHAHRPNAVSPRG